MQPVLSDGIRDVLGLWNQTRHQRQCTEHEALGHTGQDSETAERQRLHVARQNDSGNPPVSNSSVLVSTCC